MSLDSLARDLAVALARPGPFARARARQPLLDPFPSIQAVLACLAERARPDPARSDELTFALLEQHQSAGPEEAPYWAAALVLAYLPLLRRLRRRLRPLRRHDPDRDQLVLECFLQVCARFPLLPRPGRAAALLKTLTSRAVYAALNREQREQARLQLATEDELDRCEPLPWPGRPTSTRTRQRFRRELRAEGPQLSALLLEHAGRRVEPGRLWLVGETVLSGRPVRAWVRQAHPDLAGGELERACLRTAKQVSRTVALLRTALQPLRRELATVSI